MSSVEKSRLNPITGCELSYEEEALVRLVGEYETARVGAAFATVAAFPAKEAERRKASDELGRALRRYGRGFRWREMTYGFVAIGGYCELTRTPAPGPTTWPGLKA